MRKADEQQRLAFWAAPWLFWVGRTYLGLFVFWAFVIPQLSAEVEPPQAPRSYPQVITNDDLPPLRPGFAPRYVPFRCEEQPLLPLLPEEKAPEKEIAPPPPKPPEPPPSPRLQRIRRFYWWQDALIWPPLQVRPGHPQWNPNHRLTPHSPQVHRPWGDRTPGHPKPEKRPHKRPH